MQSTSILYRTYAVDLWGFGDSAKKTNFYSFEQQIDLLEGFLERIGVNKVALVGHGLGAIIALLFAIRQRQSVDRLMAVGLLQSSSTLKARLLTSSPEEFLKWLGDCNGHNSVNAAEAAKADPTAIRASLSGLLKLNLPGYTQQLGAPCLYVNGQYDHIIYDDISSESPPPLSELAQEIIFEQSGHYPMLDEASKFHRLVMDFLSIPSAENIQQLQIKEEWKRRVR
jgi:pimeloyl-ACP methyl ester carboxylesterase